MKRAFGRSRAKRARIWPGDIQPPRFRLYRKRQLRVINAKDLMRLHVETLFTRDHAGRLVAVNEPGGAEAPRFFLGRTAHGNECWFRHDLDSALIRDLTSLAVSAPIGLETEADPEYVRPFVTRLEEDDPVQKTWMGPAYCFPATIPRVDDTVQVTVNASVLSPYLEDWVGDIHPDRPFTAFLYGGRAVSVCCSVRIAARAHEAGVETHRDFRGRGHAAKVVAAWARAVREKGPIPLYSTSWENQASRSVAKKLGLIQYGTDLHVM
jgi:RimJ/RimL family protein N-acetyltransferase